MKKKIVLGFFVIITFQLTGLIYHNRIKKINAITADVVNESENDMDKQSAGRWEESPVLQLDDGDIYLLLQIAMAEAGTEDVVGKALVMCVIKNRVESEEFPNTIREVIYQCKNGVYQFSPVKNEAYQNAEITEECYEALDLVLSGWDKSQGAVYFCTPAAAGKWHEQHLTFLFEHGGHRFYKSTSKGVG